MQHREGRRAQAGERPAIVEVADDRDDAVRAQLAHVVAIAREPVETRAMPQQIRGAQRDVAAADQQNPLRHAAGVMPARAAAS